MRFFSENSMEFDRNSTTEKSPIRRLPSRGNTSPFHNFGLFSVVFHLAHSTPAWSSQTHPRFHSRGVDAHAPHQSPIRIKASWRLALAPDVCPWHRRCPRKPSVPCRVQACTAYRSHGSLTGPPFL